jgi:hypothetical protein
VAVGAAGGVAGRGAATTAAGRGETAVGGAVAGRGVVVGFGGHTRFGEGVPETELATAGVVTGRVVVRGVVVGHTRFGEGAPAAGPTPDGTCCGEARTVAFGGGSGEPAGGVLPWRPQWKIRVETARTWLPVASFGAAAPDSTMVIISLVSRACTW